MSQTELQTFDFRTAGTTDAMVTVLRSWLTKTSRTFSDGWEAVSDTVVDLKCDSVLSRTFEEGIQSVAAESVGCAILLGDKKVPTLICVSCQDLVSVIGCIVGTGEDVEFGDRKLTSIEVSLCQMLFETLTSSLSSAWTAAVPLAVALGDLEESPQFSRLIPVKELVLCTQIELTVTEAKATLTWLLPRKEVETLFEAVSESSLKHTPNNPHTVVQQIELEAVGILGNASMTMKSLSDLSVGDLLVLDQKIDDPVVLCIGDEPFFQGWPGRLGKRQGFEIENVI